MSETIETARPSTQDMLDSKQNFASIGVVISLIAFMLAISTPWIYESFAPPPPTLEDIAVEKALDIRDQVVNVLVTGETPKEDPVIDESVHWTDSWPFIVIMVAMGGIVCGTLGFISKDQRAVGALAIFFGVSAIIAIYMWIAFAVFIVVILVAAILSSIGISV